MSNDLPLAPVSEDQTRHEDETMCDGNGECFRLEAENERLQRARIGDAEIIGRWMCQAQAAEAALSALRSAVKQIEQEMRASLPPDPDGHVYDWDLVLAKSVQAWADGLQRASCDVNGHEETRGE